MPLSCSSLVMLLPRLAGMPMSTYIQLQRGNCNRATRMVPKEGGSSESLVPECATDKGTSHGIHTALQKNTSLLLGLAVRCATFCENKDVDAFVLINAVFST